MKHKKSTQVMSVILAVLMLMPIVNVLVAEAATTKVYALELPRGDDPNKSGWGHGALTYMNGWHNSTVTSIAMAHSLDSYTGKTAYCIEPGVSIYSGDSLTQKDESYWDNYPSNLNATIDATYIKDFIGRIMLYGWTGSNDINWSSANSSDANEMANLFATQYLIWETIVGERNESFGKVNASTQGKDNILEVLSGSHPLRSKIMEHYNRIEASVKSHTQLPSFMSRSAVVSATHNMTWDGSKYSVALTDTNGVLGNYSFSATGGVSCAVNGNTLTLSSSSPPSDTVTITANKKNSKTMGAVIWSDGVISNTNNNGQIQDVVTYSAEIDDPVQGFVRARVNNGSMSILKTTQHNGGSVSGFQFEVRNSGGGIVGTYTSDSSGKIDIPNLAAGDYSVKEINLSNDFVTPTPNPKTVTVVAGQNATVSFDNVKKRGVISILKNDSATGAKLKDAVFEVRDSGGALVDTITTGTGGKATTKVLPLGLYRITEKTAPNGYLLNTQTYTVTISGAQGNDAVVYAQEAVVPNTAQTGKINLRKTNANTAMGDYSLAGAVFEVYSGTTLVDTITTNSNGEAQSKALPLGSYTIKEKTAPTGFVLNKSSFTATLTYAGQNESFAYATVTVPEQPQAGVIRLHKTNAKPAMGEYSLAGAVFEIYRGTSLVDTITTDSNGETQTKELPLGAYTVKEKTAPYGLVLNTQSYNVSLTYAGQAVSVVYSDVTIPEMPQVGRITVTKRDKTTGSTAQGDSTLAGAVFEIYDSKKEKVVDTLYCGTDVKATTKELPLGTYFVREKTPPVGYTHDDNFYEVKIEYAGQEVEVTEVGSAVENKVVEGQIAITKHSDTPDVDVDPPNEQIEQPVEGAIFEVYLKSAGSFDKAKDSERDTLTTNENGYAITKKLPYGIYTVKETFAPGDLKLVEPFDVFVSADGKIYRYILNDRSFMSLVKIVKADAETGKTIPAAGTAFRVKDLSTGEWVVQHINYPTPIDIDVFETAPDGTLVMPLPLKSGDYELHEMQAPHGYVLSDVPVKFTIHSSQENPEIIEVTMVNKPVMGVITVEKQGDMLAGAREIDTEFGKQYVPVFEEMFLAGAEFDVIAAEDIITPDGTLRFAEGTVVDTIITDKNGTAYSKQLYLGNYSVVETKAPHGFVLDESVHSVSLVYENQEVAVVSSQIGVGNVQQKVEVELQKLMEKPVGAEEDFNAFSDVLFGLFANEDILANDGDTVIPKDGLIALLPIDENGKSVFNAELPFAEYYAKELRTNEYYQLNEKLYPVDVEYAGQDVAVAKFKAIQDGTAIPNELKLGKIVIDKQGEMLVGAEQIEVDGRVVFTPIFDTRPLSGARFDIIAAENIYDVYGKVVYKKGEIVDSVTTGDDGKAESKPIHLGEYLIREVFAPDGFVLDETPYTATLGFDGEVAELITKQVTRFNERCRAEISMIKIAEMPENPPDDFNPYKDILFGLYADSDILDADGNTVIPKDSLIEIIRIGDDGKAVIHSDLPCGSYYIKEIQTANGYVLDDTVYRFVFDSAQSSAAVISIAVNEGNPVHNKLQRGSLKIIKTFEGRDVPIADVPFRITGKTEIGVLIELEVRTDANGEILLENLPVGEYFVRELESALTDGYVLSPEEAAIVAHGQLTEMRIHNKLILGSIRILKTDAQTGEPLASALFGLYQNGSLIREMTTDADGLAVFVNLPFGEYEVKEIAAPAGYLLNDTVFTAVINAENRELEFSLTNESAPDMPAPTEPGKPDKPDIPKTGDTSNIVLWLGMTGAAVVCFVGINIYDRKRGKKDDVED